MNLKLLHRNLDLSDNLKKMIERKASKLRKILPTFSPEVLDLHLSIEKLPRGHRFETVLVLTTPQTSIRVEGVEDNATASVLRAFDELFRRVKRFKSQLNRERFWQRPPLRPEAVVSKGHLRDLESAINRNLDKVENYIRREIFHQAVLDGLPPGLIQPQALMDDVFLHVTSQAHLRPENVPVDQWMFQIAREKVRERLESLERAEEEYHLEERSDEVSPWDDEDLNFYQPDEVLRLEDVLPDAHSSDPEQLMAWEESEEQLLRAIAHLPAVVRESFVLYALDGFSSDEVAMITGKTPQEILADVETARAELRQKLFSQG